MSYVTHCFSVYPNISSLQMVLVSELVAPKTPSLNSLHKSGKTKDCQCFQYTQTAQLNKSRPTAKKV